MSVEVIEKIYSVSVVGTTGDVEVEPATADPATPNLIAGFQLFGGLSAGVSKVTFLRFDIDVPRQALIRRVNLEGVSAGVSSVDPGATAFVGQLVRDGKWDVGGFNVVDYPFHSSYPSPHDGVTGAIIPGRITNDAYIGSFFFEQVTWPQDRFPVSIGSEAYAPVFVVEGLRESIQSLVLEVDYEPSNSNTRGVAFVIASTDHITGGNEQAGVYGEEDGDPAAHVFLRVEYGGEVDQPTVGKNLAQVGDILLRQTNDGGELKVTNGLFEMTGRFEVAAYLSLFGGNEDDDGSSASLLGYWGNLLETEDRFKLVSRTQHLLRSIPLTTANIQRLRRAAVADLAWFLQKNIASTVDVAVAVTGVNRVAFAITITAEGEESRFTFTENWKAVA